MADKEARLKKIEQALAPDDEIHVQVNWHDDGLMEDRESGERVTPDEWRRRHPNEELILVGWPEDDETEES